MDNGDVFMDDFVWCDEKWVGIGGRWDLAGENPSTHLCAHQGLDPHQHTCCCGAVKPKEE